MSSCRFASATAQNARVTASDGGTSRWKGLGTLLRPLPVALQATGTGSGTAVNELLRQSTQVACGGKRGAGARTETGPGWEFKNMTYCT